MIQVFCDHCGAQIPDRPDHESVAWVEINYETHTGLAGQAGHLCARCRKPYHTLTHNFFDGLNQPK